MAMSAAPVANKDDGIRRTQTAGIRNLRAIFESAAASASDDSALLSPRRSASPEHGASAGHDQAKSNAVRPLPSVPGKKSALSSSSMPTAAVSNSSSATSSSGGSAGASRAPQRPQPVAPLPSLPTKPGTPSSGSNSSGGQQSPRGDKPAPPPKPAKPSIAPPATSSSSTASRGAPISATPRPTPSQPAFDTRVRSASEADQHARPQRPVVLTTGTATPSAASLLPSRPTRPALVISGAGQSPSSSTANMAAPHSAGAGSAPSASSGSGSGSSSPAKPTPPTFALRSSGSHPAPASAARPVPPTATRRPAQDDSALPGAGQVPPQRSSPGAAPRPSPSRLGTAQSAQISAALLRAPSPGGPPLTHSGETPASSQESGGGLMKKMGGGLRNMFTRSGSNANINPADVYKDESARIRSFSAHPQVQWPHNTPTPEACAAAGLFFSPTKDKPDRCKCFQCGIFMHGWEPSDEPKVEHARWKPQCAVVHTFDQSVIAKVGHPQQQQAAGGSRGSYDAERGVGGAAPKKEDDKKKDDDKKKNRQTVMQPKDNKQPKPSGKGPSIFSMFSSKSNKNTKQNAQYENNLSAYLADLENSARSGGTGGAALLGLLMGEMEKLDTWTSRDLPVFDWAEVESKPDIPIPPDFTSLLDTGRAKSEGFKFEFGRNHVVYSESTGLKIVGAERDHYFYAEQMADREHVHYIGEPDESAPIGVVIVSFETSKQADSDLHAIIRSKRGDIRFLIPAGLSSPKDILKYIRTKYPDVANLKLTRFDDVELDRALIQFEKLNVTRKYKFGLLYVKPGQTDENEMFSNVEPSPDYDEFLDWIGQRIQLQGWPNYRGGLDVKTNTTGTHSVYTKHRDYEIMFHVSTLLPFQEADLQRVERKRHLGNDIVQLMFKEGDQPFDPLCLTTHFNNIFVVISVARKENGKTFYKLAIANKTGVPAYPPFLQFPPVYEKNDEFRDFLLTKLVNSERAAMISPDFKHKMIRTRKETLEDIVRAALERQARGETKKRDPRTSLIPERSSLVPERASPVAALSSSSTNSVDQHSANAIAISASLASLSAPAATPASAANATASAAAASAPVTAATNVTSSASHDSHHAHSPPVSPLPIPPGRSNNASNSLSRSNNNTPTPDSPLALAAAAGSHLAPESDRPALAKESSSGDLTPGRRHKHGGSSSKHGKHSSKHGGKHHRRPSGDALKLAATAAPLEASPSFDEDATEESQAEATDTEEPVAQQAPAPTAAAPAAVHHHAPAHTGPRIPDRSGRRSVQVTTVDDAEEEDWGAAAQQALEVAQQEEQRYYDDAEYVAEDDEQQQ